MAALQTGIAFYKHNNNSPAKVEEEKPINEEEDDLENDDINPELDEKLAFDKRQTNYVRFDGRYFDNELVFDDYVNLLIPPVLDPSNIIQFELYLLQSDTVPKDYVVGWGVFPLVDSEF